MTLLVASVVALTACGSGNSGDSEPAPLPLGAAYSFHASNGDELTLTAQRVVDPAEVAPGQVGVSGNPFIGIVMQVANTGTMAFKAHFSVAPELVDRAGAPFYAVYVKLTNCPAPGGFASGDVEVPPNSEITTCEAFSDSPDDPLGQLWIKISGHANAVWNL